MSALLDGIASDSTFVYALAERHPFVTHSTPTLAPIGATVAKPEGRSEGQGGMHLEVWELVDFTAHRTRTYSYEVNRASERVCWYDAWEHPEIPAPAATFPQHKRVPPTNPSWHLSEKVEGFAFFTDAPSERDVVFTCTLYAFDRAGNQSYPVVINAMLDSGAANCVFRLVK